MSNEKKDKDFIKKPVYPGGNSAYAAFIKANLKYPKSAYDAKIEGTVVIKYAIDYTGKVSDTKIIKSLNAECDQEAARVIKKLVFEIPKGPRNIKVLFHKEAKIHFKLPSHKPIKTPHSTAPEKLNYTITASSKKVKPAEKIPKTNSTSYNYTVEW